MLLTLGILWLCKVIQVYSFVIQDSYNTLFDDVNSDKTDQAIIGDYYEMMGKQEKSELQADSLKFRALNRLANREYNKALRSQDANLDIFKIVKSKTYNNNIFATAEKPSQPTILSMNKSNTVNIVHYDYNDLLIEYYDDESDTTKSNRTYHAKGIGNAESGPVSSLKKIFSLDMKMRNCTDEELKHIGLNAIACLGNDYMTHRIPYKMLAIRCWKIAKIWVLVYTAIAVPLWCTRGWCCCCILCKFFKPRQTIDEAKKYIVEQPPGVLKTKLGDVQYEPTVRERECYEEFEHFIRTL